MDKTIGELFNDIFVGCGSLLILILRMVLMVLRGVFFLIKLPFKGLLNDLKSIKVGGMLGNS